MAISTNNTTSTAATTTTATTATNPNAELTSDDFMTLLIKELQYQDPTAPMDSQTMLTQTSQLSALETQENTNKLMQKLADQLEANSASGANAYAISAIGKVANTGDIKMTVTDKGSTKAFDLYYGDEVASGTISIKDKSGNVVRTIDIEKGASGSTKYVWDLKDNNGQAVEAGTYTVEATYKDKNGDSHDIKSGSYPVESVKFVDGEAKLKVGSRYISLSEVNELSDA